MNGLEGDQGRPGREGDHDGLDDQDRLRLIVIRRDFCVNWMQVVGISL